MRKLVAYLILLVHQAFGTASCQDPPAGETDLLRERIARYQSYARQFEALGMKELARYYRESAETYERELARTKLRTAAPSDS